MQYCTRCLYPANHPLNVTFDAEGVCSGCRIHEEKDRVDWSARKQHLRELLGAYRNRSAGGFDCIVPVTGAQDSWFIVHTIRREFGLNPLLVSYNKHYNTRRGHRNLAYLRTLFDVDIYSQVIRPQLVKKITRETMRLRASMYWHILAGQTVWPVHVAVRYRIPLIIWGHHQGLDQVGMFSHLDNVEMTRKYRKDHDLMGLEAEDLTAQSDLTEEDVQAFVYPHDKEISAVGVRGIYLGNYIRWDSKAQHEKMIASYGYESGTQQRTFDLYNHVDCTHYSGVHDYIKFLKHGYSKVVDHATRELRFGRLTRTEAIALVRRYQDVYPADLPAFLQWIGMDEATFFQHVDRHRDPRVWENTASGWVLRHSVTDSPEPANAAAVALPYQGGSAFVLTPSKAPLAREDEAVLIDRGFVDGTAGAPID